MPTTLGVSKRKARVWHRKSPRFSTICVKGNQGKQHSTHIFSQCKMAVFERELILEIHPFFTSMIMGGRVESQGCFFPENDFILRSHWNLCWIHYIAKKKHHNIQGGSFKQKLYKNFGMFCCHSLSAKHLAKNSPFHCPMHSNPPRWELPTKAESRPPATAPACRPTKIQLPKKKHDCIGVDHVAS